MQYLFTVVKYCKLTCCLQYCITFVDSCAMQFIKSKVPICFGYLAGCCGWRAGVWSVFLGSGVMIVVSGR